LTCCQIECIASKEQVREWNEGREVKYTSEVLVPHRFPARYAGSDEPPVLSCLRLEELLMRYEAPTSANRWDSPLFMVEADDSLPLEGIQDTLMNKPVTPNLSVKVVRF